MRVFLASKLQTARKDGTEKLENHQTPTRSTDRTRDVMVSNTAEGDNNPTLKNM